MYPVFISEIWSPYCRSSKKCQILIKISKHLKSNQIKSLLLSHHHSTSALVSEILMSVLQTVQKNNRQFTYGQTVQKTTNNLHMDRQCKKTALEHLQCSRQCKKIKKTTAIYIWTVHIYRLYRRQCAKYTYMY